MDAAASPADQLVALRTACGVLAPTRAFVAVEGADAESFLQNLLTQDLNGLADGEARLRRLHAAKLGERLAILSPKQRGWNHDPENEHRTKNTDHP